MSDRMTKSQIRSKFYHVLNHCDNMEALMPVLDELEDDHNKVREAEKFWKERAEYWMAEREKENNIVHELETANAILRKQLDVAKRAAWVEK